MDFVFKMMIFVFKMMIFVFKMMIFVFKMMNLEGARAVARCEDRPLLRRAPAGAPGVKIMGFFIKKREVVY